MVSAAMDVVKIALLFSVLMTVRCENVTRSSDQNRLLRQLLTGYDYITMRPVYNVSDATTVELELVLTQVIELNERQQTIEIEAWIQQRWTDEYMVWNPDDYNGVDHVYVHKSKIWLPDITLIKNVDRDFESYKDIPLYVRSNGLVTRATPAIFKCTCAIDAQLFPFDTQICELRFTSWAYDITEINLTEYGKLSRQTNYYTDVGVWELLNVTTIRRETKYSSGDVYPELSYYIHLKRRPLFHVLQIILPCVLLSLLSLMVFVLPPQSGEKISLGVTNLLSSILFQQLISVSLPPRGNETPIISYYFTPMIILACTSILCTVAVLSIFYRDNRHPIPNWVKFITFGILARLVCHRQSGKEARPSRNNSCNLTGDLGAEIAPSLTAAGGELSSGKSLSRRLDEADIARRLYAVTSSKTLDSPVLKKARRKACYKVETTRELHQTPTVPRAHTWQEVALIIDRAALVMSATVTVISMLTCILTFIILTHQDQDIVSRF